MIHKPVLLKEVIENLNLKPGMTVVDGTLGAGGHSMEILKKILPGGKLISIDWDKKAIEDFKSYWQGNQALENWTGVNDNFANISGIVRGLGIESVDSVFADLGFSSDQIEDAQRGFSFLKDGPLDMRYSPESEGLTAADAVNGYSGDELFRIFKDYGEEKFAGRIAKEIVKARKIQAIKRTKELVGVVSAAVPEKYKKGRIHFATKTFQALRIEVNRELENLEKFLEETADLLAGGRRVGIVAFHSLEDRTVKRFFQKESKDCLCPPNFPKCVCGHKARLKIITKKPVSASEREIRENPRSRSAKLRVAERIQ